MAKLQDICGINFHSFKISVILFYTRAQLIVNTQQLNNKKVENTLIEDVTVIKYMGRGVCDRNELILHL
jgi:hypothetical protein